MLLLGLPLRALNRVLGWIVARDCVCGASTAPDAFHRPGCPHPLRHRAEQPTEEFEPVKAALYVNGKKIVTKRPR